MERTPDSGLWPPTPQGPKRWVRHAGHVLADRSPVPSPGPHWKVPRPDRFGHHLGTRKSGRSPTRSRLNHSRSATMLPEFNTTDHPMVELDGSQGEGGGQVLRTALSLSLITGRPFRIQNIRANRGRPGLRPQHLSAVKAAARLGNAQVEGATEGSRTLTFRPQPYGPTDLDIDIGTAGSTALVLQTLALPVAVRADRPVRIALTGGTFNTSAPSFPYLEQTWRGYLLEMGLDVQLAMPSAGFFPKGGGRLEAWIEPASRIGPIQIGKRGPLQGVRGLSGSCRLQGRRVGDRMRDQASKRLGRELRGTSVAIEVADWPGPAPGAAIALVADCEQTAVPATFVGLGERGKPAERVADDAVAELLAYLNTSGAVDAHSADQILLPLALADGPSRYNVAEVTGHLRTNARTVRAFLDRTIIIDEPSSGPAWVTIE